MVIAARWAAALLVGVALAEPVPVMGQEASCPAARPSVGRIAAVDGVVRVNDRAITAAGSLVCLDDRVSVGADSRASVLVTETDTIYRVAEESTLQVLTKGVVRHLRGMLYFLSQTRQSLTVETPYVSAGIDGTEVLLKVVEGGVDIVVLDGAVSLKSPPSTTIAGLPAGLGNGEELTIRRGQAQRAGRAAAPGESIRADARQRIAWTLYYPGIVDPPLIVGLPRIGAAASLLAKGQVEEAQRLLAAIGDDTVEAGVAAALLATIASTQLRPDEADALLQRARRLAPDHPVPLLADSYRRQMRFDIEGALADALAAGRLAPRSALLRARIAELQLMRGGIREARLEAEAAAALDDTALSATVLGFAALAANDAAGARAAFDRALARESSSPTAHLGRGLAQVRLNDLRAGEQEMAIAAALDPTNALLRAYLGRVLAEGRQEAKAGEQYAIAKTLDPTDPTPWLYDALRLQRANRPVEALRALERSIALNDNRAAFRSRLLLDQDLAGRGAALGRVYRDLGFSAEGEREATRALARDPSSAPAHRLLADLYSDDPRLEVARVSEILQSQLLSPLGADLVQPSLVTTGLGVKRSSTDLAFTFNEYSRIFDERSPRFGVSGLIGSDGTRAQELSAAAQSGRLATAVGQYSYRSDGFRKNADVEHDIFNLVGQRDVSDNLQLQAEYRFRDTVQGNREVRYDPSIDSDGKRQGIEQHLLRLGGRQRLDVDSDLLINAFWTWRDERERVGSFANGVSLDDEARVRDRAASIEAQWLTHWNHGNLVLGSGAHHINREFIIRSESRPCLDPTCSLRLRLPSDTEAMNVYGYWTSKPVAGLVWTVGTGLDFLDQDEYRVLTPTPKLGIRWTPESQLELRAAAFRAVRRTAVINQTLEPTQVAGFTQSFDNLNGTKLDVIAAGVGFRPDDRTSVDLDIGWRGTSPPNFSDFGRAGDPDVSDETERFFQVRARRMLPHDIIALGELRLRKYNRPSVGAGSRPISIDEVVAPFGLRYFDRSGLYTTGTFTLLHQQVDRFKSQGAAEGRDHSLLLDASIGYRLPNGQGSIGLNFLNLLDQTIRYQDDNFRSTELPNFPYSVGRTVELRLTLSF